MAAVVRAFGEGKVELEKPGPDVNERYIRQVPGIDGVAGQYTGQAVATFLGWGGTSGQSKAATILDGLYLLGRTQRNNFGCGSTPPTSAARESRLDCEAVRKGGGLLIAGKVGEGGHGGDRSSGSNATCPIWEDVGIAAHTGVRWKNVARLPEKEFYALLDSWADPSR